MTGKNQEKKKINILDTGYGIQNTAVAHSQIGFCGIPNGAELWASTSHWGNQRDWVGDIYLYRTEAEIPPDLGEQCPSCFFERVIAWPHSKRRQPVSACCIIYRHLTCI